MEGDLTFRPVGSDELPAALDLLGFLNPDTAPEILASRLGTVLTEHPHYELIGAFADGELLGLSGAWTATRIWSGKYLEIDNFVVHPDHRSKNIGSRLVKHLESLARERGCEFMMLDTYTTYYPAHRLYHRLGFEIRAFHFVKEIS